MNKNYLIIGLIILALVVIGVIASRPGEEITIDNLNGNNGSGISTNDPSIEVSAQTLFEDQVVIDRVVSSVDGWVVIHRVDANGETDASSNVGYSRVTAGNNSGVVITLNEEVESGDMLVAMLYADTGNFGELEIDSEDEEVDAPVLVNGNVVSAPFTVAHADDVTEEETPEEEEDTETEEESAE